MLLQCVPVSLESMSAASLVYLPAAVGQARPDTARTAMPCRWRSSLEPALGSPNQRGLRVGSVTAAPERPTAY